MLHDRSAEWPSEDLILPDHLFETDSEERWTPMSDFKMALRNLLIKRHEWVEDLPNVEKLDANVVLLFSMWCCSPTAQGLVAASTTTSLPLRFRRAAFKNRDDGVVS